MDLTVLTRGRRPANLPDGVNTLQADMEDPLLAGRLKSMLFDVVVNWIGYTPADVERDLASFFRASATVCFLSARQALIRSRPAAI